MSEPTEVDELFGTEGGQPTPRLGLVWGLLATGLGLTILGLACSAVPGGLVVLASWWAVDREWDRVGSGYLPADTAPRVRLARQVVVAALVFVLLMFVLQGWLLYRGVYASAWTEAWVAIRGAPEAAE